MKQKPGNILGMLTSLQSKMAEAQKKLEASEFNGEAQGGLVKVVLMGNGTLKSLTIDPQAMSEDAETVAALVSVAFSKAFEAKEAAAKQVLSAAAGGLMPMGFKLPGFG